MRFSLGKYNYVALYKIDDELTSSARMCLFFWLKNFEGSERVFHVNFMHSQVNLGPQSPVFFSGTRILLMGDFFVFFVFYQDGYHGFDLA